MSLFNLRRNLNAEEHAACAVGLLLFPLLSFLIVMLGRGWIWDHAEVVLIGLPVLFSAMAYAVARALGNSVAFALTLVPPCAVACFICGSGAGLLAAMASFLETF